MAAVTDELLNERLAKVLEKVEENSARIEAMLDEIVGMVRPKPRHLHAVKGADDA